MLAANLSFVGRDIAAPAERLNYLVQAGFRRFEGALVDFSIPAVRTALTRHGARVVLANSHMGNLAAGDRGIAALPERREEFRKTFATDVALAAELGIPKLHVMAGIGDDPAQNMNVYLDNLQWALAETAQHEIQILVEPISTVAMPGYLIADMSAFNVLRQALHRENRFGLLFDIYHLSNMGVNVAAEAASAQGIIRHVQIADPVTRRLPDLSNPVMAGLVTALSKANPTAGFGLECFVDSTELSALSASLHRALSFP